MVFWQLTVDAHDPVRLAAFWAAALGYVPEPPTGSAETWHRHYRRRLGHRSGFEDRIFDPDGKQPPLWFQRVPEDKAGKNRLHLDLYPTGRDHTLSQDERIAAVGRRVTELLALGATVIATTREDDPDDPVYFLTLADPEGNEFCVSG